MAWETPGFKLPAHAASEDLSAAQYTAVIVDGAGTVGPATAAERMTGILQNDPESGRAAEVMVSGVSKAIAGEELATPGTILEVGTGGKLVALDAGVAVAQLLDTAAADGDLITVLIIHN